MPDDRGRGRRALRAALLAGALHLAAATLALRALLAALAAGERAPALLQGAVAVLAFPLFYTPVPRLLFGGRPYTGLYVAALNALLWGAVVYGVVRRRPQRGRSLASSAGG